MSRDIGSFAPDLASWTRGFDDCVSIFQRMSAHVKTLDQQLQEATAELRNESETRKNWMKRAIDAENRQKQQQFILVLLDGNQRFFKDEVIRDGGARAVESLMIEVQETARSRHKNDLASDIRVVTHVFADTNRLAQDLVSAGSLSDPQQLEDFIKGLTAVPLLNIVDCGPGRKPVDEKLQAYYELFIENVHCRHIILGLGDDSEYFATLDMYNEDVFTLEKTSLLKPVHGFPSKYKLPFHQVEFSTINAVPLISFNADEPGEDQTPVRSNSSDKAQSSVSSSIPQREGSGSGSGGESGQLPSLPSSRTSDPALSPSRALPAAVSREAESKHSVANSVLVPLQPSTYSETKALYEQDWERSFGEHSYMPPPCTTPWGQEQDQDMSENIDTPFKVPAREEQKLPKRSYAEASEPAAPQGKPTAASQMNGTRNDTSRKGPTSYRGTWDDLVSGKAETTDSASLPGLPVQGDVAVNRFGDRIDLPLPHVSQTDKNRLNDRVSKGQKLCNEHYLRRSCHNQRCRYEHEPIDAGLLNALRHIARTQACDIGSGCRMSDCCYGHHCPSQIGGKTCKHPNCSFKKMSLHHIRDLKVAEVIPAPQK